MFKSLSRQEFRRYFQPSRIAIGVLPDPDKQRLNLITICFQMHCSYKPPMVSFAVWHGSHTYSLLDRAGECVLAVPGERLANVALICGTRSGNEVDKANLCGLSFAKSEYVQIPGIQECIANVELRVVNKIRTGDHMTVIGEVQRFGVDIEKNERCLLSVGPEHQGYEVLAHQGIHRIGVVRGSTQSESNKP
jgi:flavin reductase (DIM6/NTAB) family NADH-FMN oxidoreductase RutF